jgi:hypothetical protein
MSPLLAGRTVRNRLGDQALAAKMQQRFSEMGKVLSLMQNSEKTQQLDKLFLAIASLAHSPGSRVG